MPKKNGLQVIEAFRRYIKQKDIEFENLTLLEPRFVFLTAFASKTFKQLLESKGIMDVYEKPL